MRLLITNWVKWPYSDLIKGKDRRVSGLVGLIVTKTYLRKRSVTSSVWCDGCAFGSFVTSECGGPGMVCFTGLTSDIQSQIWSGQLSSATPCKILSSQLAHVNLLPSSRKTIPVIIKVWVLNAGAAEMRETRHERGSTETWYYQLLPQNIRDTAISRANNHTICWEGSWVQWLTMTVISLPVVPVLPLWRFPTNCRPKARYEHQICE